MPGHLLILTHSQLSRHPRLYSVTAGQQNASGSAKDQPAVSICRQAALLFVGLSLAAQEPGKPVENVADYYSLEKEAAIGRQLALETQRRTEAINDPGVEEYVKRLGLRISARMPEAKFPFTFSVITDDPCPSLHEPLAIPGGYIFVPAALLIEVHDEAEFAGMLAHLWSMSPNARRRVWPLAANW